MNEEIDIAQPYKVNMLMALTGLALAREADELAQPMFDLIRHLRPQSPRVDSFEGWLCMRRGDMLGATRHLTAAVQALGPDAGSSRTLLAMVLCAQGDPSWLTQAQAVIDEGADPHGIFLLKSMRGDPDVQPVATPEPTHGGLDQAGPAPALQAEPAKSVVAESAPTHAAPSPAPATSAAASRDHRMVFLRG